MNNRIDLDASREGAEAAAWFERLRSGDFLPADNKRFARWLAESPVHVREYLGVAEAWGVMRTTDCWPAQTREKLFDALRAMRPTDIAQLKPHTLDRVRPFALRLATAAAIAILAINGVCAWWWLRERNDYQTARGEQRSVVLGDGSVVQLNTLTKIVVHFDREHRRIELPQGEAFFRVAHDATRPFEVDTPFARVRAVGTEFNVYNRPDGTRVAVVEGRVQVGAASDSQPQLLALAATQSIDIGAKGKIRAIAARVDKAPPAETATAWIQRRIVLDDTPLDTAVAEFNRYNRLQMQIDDINLSKLHITGLFSADDPLALANYLSRIQNVQIERNGEVMVLRRNP